MVLVIENFAQIHALDMINLVKWLIAAGPQPRVGYGNLSDRDVAQVFDLWRYHKSIQKSLEVIDEAHLARLTNAFAVREPLQAEKLGRPIDVLVETEVYEKAGDRRAGPPFPRVAMHD